MNEKGMTYGQRAVGLTFNPSGDPKVQRIKELYAEIIDLCSQEENETRRMTAFRPEKGRLFLIAIEHAQTAQMWGVRALTWRELDES